MTTFLPVVSNVITISNDKMLSSFHGQVYNVNSMIDVSNHTYCLNIELLNVDGNKNQMIDFEIFFNNKSTINEMKINGNYFSCQIKKYTYITVLYTVQYCSCT